MTITKDSILELKKKIAEATSNAKGQEICPDTLFPAPKGKKKTSTLLAELDEILVKANEKKILVEDIPDILDNIEKVCLELENRFNESKSETGAANQLIELEKEAKELYTNLEKLINEKIGKFI